LKKLIVILVVLIFLLSFNSNIQAQENWYDTSWQRRKLITINCSYIDTNLRNFPVWIYDVSEEFKDINNGGYVQPDGDDFLFVSYDNVTKLNHEIEIYNGTIGEIGIWVNVTYISSDQDTKFWIYYNNSFCNNQENVTGVWDDNFTGVWHLKENPDIASEDDIFDSSYPHYNGTDIGNTTRDDGITGYSIYLDGDSGRIEICTNETGDIADVLSDDNIGTVEFWIKKKDEFGTVITLNDYNESADYIYFGYAYHKMRGDLGIGGDWRFLGETNISSNWNYLVFASNGTYNFFYLNANAENVTWEQGYNNGTWFDETLEGQDTFTIGAIIRENANTGFCNASIDEVRISNIQRNESWIKATYHTCSNPDFLSIGMTETVGISIISISPENGATNVEPLTPTTITVSESEGNPMNITWYSNTSGEWLPYGYNFSVYNGTYSQINLNFSANLTTYYWRVYIESSSYSLTSEIFSFTTRPSLIPDPPTNVQTDLHLPTNSLNISWTKGNRSDYTLVVKKQGDYPSTYNDGTLLYNGTGTYYNDTNFTSGWKYRLWAYNETGNYYSSPVNADYGVLDINCYNESSLSPIIFDVFISDREGKETYIETNCTNTHSIDIEDIPYGYNTIIKISSEGYNDRIYYMDLFPNQYYLLNTYLPPKIETKQYLFQIINEANLPVPSIKLNVGKYINETVGYENITILLTDGYGQVSTHLIPNFLYKIYIEETKDVKTPKYKKQIDDFLASETDLEHNFKIYFIEDKYRNITRWKKDITFEGYIKDNRLYINYSDALKRTSLVKFTVYEYNVSTNILTSFFSYYCIENECSFSIDINVSNMYVVKMEQNHSYYGYIIHVLEFKVREKITTKTRFNLLFEANYGTNPFGWSNFIGFMIVIACLFSFGERGSGLSLIGTGFVLLFINNIIGFTVIAVVVPIVFIILGMLVEWNNRQKEVHI